MPRSPNFTQAELNTLAKGYQDQVSILEGAFDPGLTNAAKNEAWRIIAENVNAVGGFNRPLQVIKKKYANLKTTSKEIESFNKKEMKKTGGGAAKLKVHTAITEIVATSIPIDAIEGVVGGIDTSNVAGNFLVAYNKKQCELDYSA